VWDPHQGGFWGRNFPTREFEGMDSLMMAARLFRVLAAAKKIRNMLIIS